MDPILKTYLNEKFAVQEAMLHTILDIIRTVNPRSVV